jgi:hypothetical protein
LLSYLYYFIAIDRTHASQTELKFQDGKPEAFKRLYEHAKNRFSSLNLSIDGENDVKKHTRNISDFHFSEKVGPGTYDLPQLIGKNNIQTSKRNYPSYSIGTQDKKQLLVLCKSQAESQKGQESPGVCKYETNTLKLKLKGPNVIIGREKRFCLDKERSILNKSIPHFYDTADRNSIKEYGNKTNSFTKFNRFFERERKAHEDKVTPSSQSYNTEIQLKGKSY